MKTALKFVCLSFAAIIIAGTAFWFLVADNNGERKNIPPQVNADGTIDYTLIPKGMTADEAQWVLRLPKELKVVLPENGPKELNPEDVGKTPFDIAIAKDQLIPNLNFSFALSMFDLSLVEVPWIETDESLAHIILENDPNSSEMVRLLLDRDLDETCIVSKEISTELFELARPPEFLTKESESRIRTSCSDVDVTFYAAFDDLQQHYVTFQCRNALPRSCFGAFYISPNKRVFFAFDYKHINKTRQLHKKVVTFIKSATMKNDNQI